MVQTQVQQSRSTAETEQVQFSPPCFLHTGKCSRKEQFVNNKHPNKQAHNLLWYFADSQSIRRQVPGAGLLSGKGVWHPAWQPEFDGRRELPPMNCPLTFTCALWHIHLPHNGLTSLTNSGAQNPVCLHPGNLPALWWFVLCSFLLSGLSCA